jgi:hypothetical protein
MTSNHDLLQGLIGVTFANVFAAGVNTTFSISKTKHLTLLVDVDIGSIFFLINIFNDYSN